MRLSTPYPTPNQLQALCDLTAYGESRNILIENGRWDRQTDGLKLYLISATADLVVDDENGSEETSVFGDTTIWAPSAHAAIHLSKTLTKDEFFWVNDYSARDIAYFTIDDFPKLAYDEAGNIIVDSVCLGN